MRVLITGASGFLGKHLTARLLDLGHTVTAYDQRPTLPENQSDARLTFIGGDVTSVDALVYALKTHKVEAVVHLATLLTAACATDPVRATLVNGVGTAAVFEASWQAGAHRVVFGSSVAALGLRAEPAPGDATALHPTSVYGATKAFGELLAQALATQRPEQMLVGLRFGWVYGPGRVRGWNTLQQMIEAFALDLSEAPYPDYAEPNDWTYVDDAVNAIVLALQAFRPGSSVYNVPGDYRTVQEAVAYLHNLFPDTRPMPYPAGLSADAWDFRLDGIANDLGYHPSVSLEDGLRRTAVAVRRLHGLPSTIGE